MLRSQIQSAVFRMTSFPQPAPSLAAMRSNEKPGSICGCESLDGWDCLSCPPMWPQCPEQPLAQSGRLAILLKRCVIWRLSFPIFEMGRTSDGPPPRPRPELEKALGTELSFSDGIPASLLSPSGVVGVGGRAALTWGSLLWEENGMTESMASPTLELVRAPGSCCSIPPPRLGIPSVSSCTHLWGPSLNFCLSWRGQMSVSSAQRCPGSFSS